MESTNADHDLTNEGNMSDAMFFLGRPPDEWLAEYRRIEKAVAALLPEEGGRCSIGDDWLDLLPVTDDDGLTEVHILDRSDPDLTLFDAYERLVGRPLRENIMLASDTKPEQQADPVSELRRQVEDLYREVAALKRSSQQGRAKVASPYLTAEEAAQYLGITMDSLYGQVERRRLIPLRGPKRSYRFTTAMLDAYLKGGEGKR